MNRIFLRHGIPEPARGQENTAKEGMECRFAVPELPFRDARFGLLIAAVSVIV